MPAKRPAHKIKPLKRRGSSLHLLLAQNIGERIIDGTYAPGTRLPNEAEWGQMFGASRTAVREAIKTLNGKGLLVSKPKIGSHVEPRDRWNLLDRDVLNWHGAAIDRKKYLISLQEVRRILEPGITALAARKRTAPQLQRLRLALDGMKNAKTAEDVVAPDVDFHLALIAAANNDLLVPFGIIIEQALARLFEFTSRHNRRPEHVLLLHAEVLHAVEAGDPARAIAAVNELLDDTDAVIETAPEPVEKVRRA